MPPTLRTGSIGFDVALLQLQLNVKGSPSPNLVVDGSFGSRTHAAVTAFQRQAGLSPDGTVGKLTHGVLAQGPALTAVRHGVTHVAQPTSATCWAAATAMLIRSTVPAVRARTPADMVASDGGLLNSSATDQAVVTGSRYGAIHGTAMSCADELERRWPPQRPAPSPDARYAVERIGIHAGKRIARPYGGCFRRGERQQPIGQPHASAGARSLATKSRQV